VVVVVDVDVVVDVEVVVVGAVVVVVDVVVVVVVFDGGTPPPMPDCHSERTCAAVSAAGMDAASSTEPARKKLFGAVWPLEKLAPNTVSKARRLAWPTRW
jgi:hypothetical protein